MTTRSIIWVSFLVCAEAKPAAMSISHTALACPSPTVKEFLTGYKMDARVLDLCCGSGAIGISMAKFCPNVKKVLCTDISGEALAVAKENAKAAGVEKKTEFASGDMFEALGKRAKFDMIISNPPYIESSIIPTLQREVREYEPMLALDGGEDGLDFYRTIIEQAPKFLDKKGILMLEIGYNQAEQISAMLEETDAFAKTEIVRDYGGNNRVRPAQIDEFFGSTFLNTLNLCV